ncbi:outer membrane receptor protein involved in Fe transport [Hydrogenophaga palleronii]|uniref:Outer membrane receptor protein involved in Fe transport n=1 Tax=Hydrogenophaga palleronii TaxID=65655 RepID=A0ABU1WKC7_9BURK|nr:type III effector protein chaperone [Hydrogenophaga palleronii]MDR7149743.1 outer membrane receptor protein involved in Fe transport [Hydrogenophaga palleronii]
MTSTFSTAAVNAPATDAAYAALLARAHDLTRDASQALGLNTQAAAQAAVDGGVVLDGALVTVSALPLDPADGPLANSKLMVSVDTGRRLQDLSAQAAVELLAQAPGLLAVFDAAIGCQPDGAIVLHRVMSVVDTAAGDLAHSMRVARQLARLLDVEMTAAKEQ